MIQEISALLRGRIDKTLARRFTFDCGVMTLGQYLERYQWAYRRHTIERHGKKRHGCYTELKNPKHAYTLWRVAEGDRYVGMDVPKIVYEHVYSHLLER